MNILHVAPHYGGGVGSIIHAWIQHDTENSHTLTYLNNDPINDKPGQSLLDPSIMTDFDIVLCHVWNHPSFFDFVVNTAIPPCRMIGWSHMAGTNYPYILFPELIDFFDDFFYTSPVSCLSGLTRYAIWSTCSIEQFTSLEKTPHGKFTIGYIGTIDFCKLHPDFIKICSEIDIPDAEFIVVGGGNDLQTVKDQAAAAVLPMSFTGPVPDVKPLLSTFDVFLYPLQPCHYGTAEQAIGEALGAGIPVIVLSNPAEKFIIQHRMNGCICNSPSEMASAIKDIHDKNIIFDEKIIRDSAKKMYSVEKKISEWNKIFSEIKNTPKKIRSWESKEHPFIVSLGPIGSVFRDLEKALLHGDSYDIEEYFIPRIKAILNKNPCQWRSDNKGSINQYARYFPEYKLLQEIKKLL